VLDDLSELIDITAHKTAQHVSAAAPDLTEIVIQGAIVTDYEEPVVPVTRDGMAAHFSMVMM
jgi:urease alpha subunit